MTAQVIKTYASGARTLELDDFQFTMAANGRISWATPEGWWEIVNDRKRFPILPNPMRYPDDEYTYAGPIA